MRRHTRSIALSLLLVLPLGGVAAAAIPSGTPGPGLASVGPVNTTDGFPVWYKDKNGLRLTDCVAAADPLCPARGTLPDESAPISFPDNYPDEGFYALADTIMDTANGGRARAVIALEQAFRNGGVADGDQVTFARVRYKITNAVDGVDYKITSPVGVKVEQTSKPGLIFDTEDIGIGGVGDFSGALGGRIGPFLTWDTYPNDAALAPVNGKDTYIGDGGTPHAITGSPGGTNFFRVEGPGINPNPTVDACPTVGGPLADCVENSLFTIQGKVATTNGVTADKAVYSRSSAGAGLIDVFATSEADSTQSIQVSDANAAASAREFATTGLAGTAGHYFSRVAFTGAQPPAKVQLSNIGDVPVTNKVVDVVDGISGTATYDTDSATLNVNAVSTDTTGGRTLTATGFGALTAGALTVSSLAAPPVTVTVTSDAGGSVTLPVTVTGAARAAIPVVAAAGPDQTVVQGANVTLDGTASSGDIRTFAWTSPAGISLTNPTTATPSFTAPAPGDYAFSLTVTGPAGSSTATVTVTVTAATAPVANAGLNQTVQRGTKVTLDGSGSTGAATFVWTQTGGPTVALTGATTAKPTFTFPFFKASLNNVGPLTFSLQVQSGGVTSAPATVTVTPTSDAVAITKAQYTANKSQWRVDGTSSILAGQTVTAHLGGLNGPVIGTSVVDATGAFSVRASPAGIIGTVGQTVSVESPLGGTATGFVIKAA